MGRRKVAPPGPALGSTRVLSSLRRTRRRDARELARLNREVVQLHRVMMDMQNELLVTLLSKEGLYNLSRRLLDELKQYEQGGGKV